MDGHFIACSHDFTKAFSQINTRFLKFDMLKNVIFDLIVIFTNILGKNDYMNMINSV